MTASEQFVRVEGLSKSFDGTQVFKNLNFNIAAGELITLLGPSGCGKSTLLRCIAGLERPDEGKIIVAGEDITHLKAQKRAIGMVFQSYALFPNMNVASNIAFGLKMMKMPAAEIAEKVAWGVKLVELSGNEGKYPHQLSGGQRQRVALARALVTAPRILLLDEPLSALDARIRRSLRDQIREIQTELKLTTIFVTHDQEEAMTVSDRIFLMNRGKIVQMGAPEDIYLNPADEFAARFIGSYNLLEGKVAKNLASYEGGGSLVAVRPEAIFVKEPGGIYPQGVSAPVAGRVVSHQLLGNIIRYTVEAAGEKLTVDVMNRSIARLYEPGSDVELLFNLSEFRGIPRG